MRLSSRLFMGVCLLAAPLCLFAQDAASDNSQSFEARIESVQQTVCGEDAHPCVHLFLKGESGQFRDQEMTINTDQSSFVGGRIVPLQPGQHIVLDTQMINGQQRFVFTDLVRRPVLLALVGFFLLCVFAVGGFSAIRSVFGMVVSFVLLFALFFPAMLAGYPPLLVGLVGSLVIMAITFFVTHGWNAKMQSALLGTGLSLFLTAGLALAFSHWAHLFGLGDEDAVFLLSAFPHLDTRGILLASIMIGTLGSLDDVTISQASAVFELKKASPSLSLRELYRSALRIGRDHIAGAINTLILAYAGASLPLLLLVTSDANHQAWSMLINRETFATEIVRTLVGSIGLLAAIPFTNLFASYFASKMPAAKLSRLERHHHHH